MANYWLNGYTILREEYRTKTQAVLEQNIRINLKTNVEWGTSSYPNPRRWQEIPEEELEETLDILENNKRAELALRKMHQERDQERKDKARRLLEAAWGESTLVDLEFHVSAMPVDSKKYGRVLLVWSVEDDVRVQVLFRDFEQESPLWVYLGKAVVRGSVLDALVDVTYNWLT